jgi:hypothetical protein
MVLRARIRAMTKSTVVNLQVVLVRSLLDRAFLAANEQTDIGVMTAMLLADVAVETLAKAASMHLGIKVGERANIYELIEKLEKKRPELQGRDEMAAVVKLRNARNPVQHAGSAPSQANTRMWIDEANAFAELLTMEVWGLEFSKISVVSLVRDPVLGAKLKEAKAKLDDGEALYALRIVAGVFKVMRIRWKRKTREACGLDLTAQEGYLTLRVSEAAAAVFGEDERLSGDPKLVEDKYGPIAELTLGFSLEELLALRSAVTVVKELLRHPKDAEPLQIETTTEHIAKLIEIVARQLWRLETTQPTLFGPSAWEDMSKRDTLEDADREMPTGEES